MTATNVTRKLAYAPRPSRYVIAVGDVFGRWTVVRHVGRNAARTLTYLCRCECGVERVVATHGLRLGTSKSCGCLHRELVAQRTSVRNTTHGMSRWPEYSAWKNMRARCSSSTHKDWSYYGGRGIRVCDRWQSFEVFIADMGRRPSPRHSVERRDNDGNYELSNCYWATIVEQANNRRPRGTARAA